MERDPVQASCFRSGFVPCGASHPRMSDLNAENRRADLVKNENPSYSGGMQPVVIAITTYVVVVNGRVVFISRVLVLVGFKGKKSHRFGGRLKQRHTQLGVSRHVCQNGVVFPSSRKINTPTQALRVKTDPNLAVAFCWPPTPPFVSPNFHPEVFRGPPAARAFG